MSKADAPLLERCPYCHRAANADARRTADRGYALVKTDKQVKLPVSR